MSGGIPVVRSSQGTKTKEVQCIFFSKGTEGKLYVVLSKLQPKGNAINLCLLPQLAQCKSEQRRYSQMSSTSIKCPFIFPSFTMHLLFVPIFFYKFSFYPKAVKILHINMSKAQIKRHGVTKATSI